MLNIEILISASPLPLANQSNQPAQPTNHPDRQPACLLFAFSKKMFHIALAATAW